VNALSHMYTTNFSALVERIGATEMGRKSDRQTGCVILGTVVTRAVNYDAGTMPS